MTIKRGNVVLVDLEPVKGSEQGKTRPCLIIQNNKGNEVSPTTIIAAITSKAEKEYPFTVHVTAGDGNLPKDSAVLCNQIRTISSKDRIIKTLGSLKPEIMKKVDTALKTSMALD
ncbi:MAG: type II toxin-antitoxin system PemK/MazF family toxin [Candidatus Diapherotrites archaeon]|uniref:Type II toxin-antitoxin system PemK/MazF family toxin n=1 Tax=Candidatus Iainarchaeum sp. TaxID=3101447 RepID=A0A8T3YK96_9ARCH|nr:type II toxin-antitoxin system PemK/MazF family toxin [Candidatus Diapherotrites archaeon]